jgi:hypothetical protein
LSISATQSRLNELTLDLSLKKSREMPPAIGKSGWVDAEIRDDETALTALATLGVTGCSRCHSKRSIVAQVSFVGSDLSLALCRPCYRELMKIARQPVV